MKKGTLTLFLLLAISIPLSAQYIVQGVVTDSLTREPLSYVSVRLKNTTEGTTTGSDGRFYFKTHRSEGVLVISTVGYNEYSRLIHPARNQENNYREYSEADVEQLQEIKKLRLIGIPVQEIKEIYEDRLTLQEALSRKRLQMQ